MNKKKATTISVKTIILSSIVIIIVLGALGLVILPDFSSTQTTQSNIGFPAKSFVLPTTQGTLYNMSQDIGHKVIILDFMATWCGPCAREAQELSIIYQNFSNIVIVSITIFPKDSASVLGNWSHTSHYNWTFVPFKNQTVNIAMYYRISEVGIPVTILINKQGIVEVNNIGYTSYTTIEQWIKIYA